MITTKSASLNGHTVKAHRVEDGRWKATDRPTGHSYEIVCERKGYWRILPDGQSLFDPLRAQGLQEAMYVLIMHLTRGQRQAS